MEGDVGLMVLRGDRDIGNEVNVSFDRSGLVYNLEVSGSNAKESEWTRTVC